jgi:drug/metabolite transporter (DMT)-like permease
MPVVAIGWGILDGEPLMPAQLAMIALVLLGVYLVSLTGRK